LQGKTAATALRIVEDPRLVEEAGAFAILLELVPDRVSEIVTRDASVPVLGLGSGPHAHGQLLILHDVLGLYPDFSPRMSKVFADAARLIGEELGDYVREVRSGEFPREENTFGIDDQELSELREQLEARAGANKGADLPQRFGPRALGRSVLRQLLLRAARFCDESGGSS
jgi:3-methyl-2-oxobutanoate hydroxymethyltransferase